MQTKDPNLIKTPIDKTSTDAEHGFNDNEDITATMQETVIGSEYLEDHPALQTDEEGRALHTDAEPHMRRSAVHHERRDQDRLAANPDPIHHDELEDNTQVNKGTDTFEEGIVETEHVNDDDNPARQPDRRDQEGGTPFDGDINDDTIGSEAPKSEEITERNRYASIDNAQSRILTPDEKGDESIRPRGMGE